MKCLNGEALSAALVERGVAVEGVTQEFPATAGGEVVKMMNGLRVRINPWLFPTDAQLAEIERSKAAFEGAPKGISKEELAELQTVYIRALNAVHGAYWLHYADPNDPFNGCAYGSTNDPDRLAKMIQGWEEGQLAAEARYMKGEPIVPDGRPWPEHCEMYPKQVRAVWPYVWHRHLQATSEA